MIPEGRPEISLIGTSAVSGTEMPTLRASSIIANSFPDTGKLREGSFDDPRPADAVDRNRQSTPGVLEVRKNLSCTPAGSQKCSAASGGGSPSVSNGIEGLIERHGAVCRPNHKCPRKILTQCGDKEKTRVLALLERGRPLSRASFLPEEGLQRTRVILFG